MKTIRPLTTEELAAFEKKPADNRRKEVAAAFDTLLADVTPDTWVTSQLDDDEKKDVARYQLKQAAMRRGLTAEFKRTRDQTLIFRLLIGTHDAK